MYKDFRLVASSTGVPSLSACSNCLSASQARLMHPFVPGSSSEWLALLGVHGLEIEELRQFAEVVDDSGKAKSEVLEGALHRQITRKRTAAPACDMLDRLAGVLCSVARAELHSRTTPDEIFGRDRSLGAPWEADHQPYGFNIIPIRGRPVGSRQRKGVGALHGVLGATADVQAFTDLDGAYWRQTVARGQSRRSLGTQR